MRYQRLVIDAGQESFALEFHAGLTVISGIGALEREGLVNELIGALGTGRPGVHLEMMSDAGNRFALFRPAGARHCVVDIATAQDVSSSFRNPDGSIDILRRAGLDQKSARRALCLGAESLRSKSEEERWVATLARIDQGRLWDVAAKVTERETALGQEAHAVGATVTDTETAAAIESRHRAVEQAREANERIGSTTMWASLVASLCAVPLGLAFGRLVAVPFVAAAIGAALGSIRHHRATVAAEQAEAEALDAIGASDYLTYQLERVNGLLSSDGGRRQLMSAAEAHRAALMEWRLIAGDVSVAWAAEHRDAIREMARTEDRSQLGRSAQSTTEVISEVVADVAGSIEARLAEARTIGPGGECFPVILDEPFAGLPDTARPQLLEAVSRSSSEQQIILLTNDPAVASWARVESLTGAVTVIEPAAQRESATENPTERRHVAA